MFRLADDRALLNRMGFNNHGAGELALRLEPQRVRRAHRGQHRQDEGHRRRRTPVDDYTESARLVGPLASFLVVNVSSPNTPGLRDLQAVESLRPILAAVRAETTTPVLVKIAPDLSDSDVDEIADLAVELGLAGIVATNTTMSRDGLATPGVDELGAGGISGPPVAQRSAEVLRRLYGRVGDRLVLISVGGIETADDAWERITVGRLTAAGLHRLRLRRRPVGQAHSRRPGPAAARRRVRVAGRRRVGSRRRAANVGLSRCSRRCP